ncbi:phosphoribosylanthranilate isomerase [Candidatus Woesearchaeota archaeon]|nr:phosphoribosylanthranilate isomerase [Candidatus Woesearchaeota archaeon]
MTKVKICGIKAYEDAINAVNLGADYLGFNFYRHSPRYIGISKAKNIMEKLPKNVKKVGIFVNENVGKIKKTADACDIDIIQLSGDEGREFVINLKKLLSKKIIKSFRAIDSKEIEKAKQYKSDYIMLDSYKKGYYGGTGAKFNWNLAKRIDRRRLFLSGGLNAYNVKLAINKVRPYAVDACSSTEICPGKKDYNKIKEFIEAAK